MRLLLRHQEPCHVAAVTLGCCLVAAYDQQLTHIIRPLYLAPWVLLIVSGRRGDWGIK